MREQFIPSIREYTRLWGLDRRRLGELADHAVVMHPGPMNRGVELTADVADAPNALISQQVANGVAVRMSCLYLMLGGEDRARSVAAVANPAEAPPDLSGVELR